MTPSDLLTTVSRAASEWLSILDALDHLVILETAEGTVARCNQAAAAHMGLSVRQAVGESLATRLWRDGECPAADTGKQTLRIRNSDDWFEHVSYPLADGRGVHLLVNINDRQQLQAVAEGLNVSDNLNFMVTGIRHELGNPLNSLKMAMSVLRERLPSLQQSEILVYLTRMGEQVQRMEYLLQLLRSFSVSEVVQPTPTDLVQAVDSFIALSCADLERQNVTLRAEHTALPPIVGDARALQQVLSNLVANAVDARKPDSPLLITFASEKIGQRVVLVVTDNGSGMSPKQLSMLFRPFVSTKPHGSGLGLSIVRRLLATLGASIAFRSQVGTGTQVELSFVVAESVP